MTGCPGCRPRLTAHADRDAVEAARLTYATGAHPVAREVERRTLGSDCGANGYATLAEVLELPELLDLRPGRRLLDVGAGQGWPGLHLSETTGCDVVLTDVPIEGPRVAARRAADGGIRHRVWPVVARGEALPLRPATVDAVVHTDVLCCLEPKLALLDATRTTLRPGGATAFTVIFPAADLSPADARRAAQAGPPHCATPAPYPDLLRAAGFVDIAEHDLTPAYLATARRKLHVAAVFADGMADMLGPAEFEDMQARRRLAVDAIADGLLRRARFVARRPAGDGAHP